MAALVPSDLVVIDDEEEFPADEEEEFVDFRQGFE